jgi:DNA-binding PadR family transcriptional regulator
LSTSSLAVLGLVSIRPTSGYDLVAFADRSIAYFWSIPRSQVYRELPRLEELGLIAGTHVPQTSAPDKRVHEITEEGQSRPRAWVESPTLPTPGSKDGFLLKVLMARYARPESLGPLLCNYRESVKFELTHLQAIVEPTRRLRAASVTSGRGGASCTPEPAWRGPAKQRHPWRPTPTPPPRPPGVRLGRRARREHQRRQPPTGGLMPAMWASLGTHPVEAQPYQRFLYGVAALFAVSVSLHAVVFVTDDRPPWGAEASWRQPMQSFWEAPPSVRQSRS